MTIEISNDNPAREWQAYEDPEGPIGCGATREEALIDLVEKVSDRGSRYLREREEWRAAAQGWAIGGERITKAENCLSKSLSEVTRRKPSGCCCVFDDDGETLLKTCDAHKAWRAEYAGALAAFVVRGHKDSCMTLRYHPIDDYKCTCGWAELEPLLTSEQNQLVNEDRAPFTFEDAIRVLRAASFDKAVLALEHYRQHAPFRESLPAIKEPDTAEAALARQGVYAGAGGLRGLAECQDFWDSQEYGTRLYYGPGGGQYLHRSVLKAAIDALDGKPPYKRPAERTEMESSDAVFLTPSMFHDQGLRLTQRDGQWFLQQRDGDGWKDVAIIQSPKPKRV